MGQLLLQHANGHVTNKKTQLKTKTKTETETIELWETAKLQKKKGENCHNNNTQATGEHSPLNEVSAKILCLR